MAKEKAKAMNSKSGGSKSGAECCSKSYRLKCAKTANGLSHFVMYGDVPKGKTLV